MPVQNAHGLAARVLLLALIGWTFVPGATAGSRAAATPPIETTFIAGTRYLRLGDWARANGLEVRWIQPGESVSLTNRNYRLVFEKDSREAEINGIRVGLSYAFVLRDGAGYLSEVDAATTVRPILSPPVNRDGQKINTVVIDAGHGGRDPGFQDGANTEKKYTLLLAKELGNQLTKAGYKVVLTRGADQSLELSERAEIANRRQADLFISLHWNSSATARSEVKGVQIYCLTPAGASSSNAGGQIRDAGTKPGNRNNEKNMFLAYQLQKSLTRKLGVEDRGIRRARFAVLCGAEMPAVLIEGGFMSHPSESKKIYDADYRKQMAGAIVDGVQAYAKQVTISSPRGSGASIPGRTPRP